METKSPETNMKTSNIITLLLWVVGIIIGALAIAAIAAIGDVDSEIENISTNISYVNSVLIAMLVLLVLMGCVSLAVCFMNKSKNNYEVNKDAEKGGKENTAFDHGESSKKTGEQNGSTALPAGPGDEKWVSNYVPFGDFPKGNNAQ